MKEVDMKLVSELMRNSRQSDHEIAKKTGFSQSTISRALRKIEKEGLIREYVAVPDFYKLGYELAAITFVKLRQDLDAKELEEARRMSREKLENGYSPEAIMVARGVGLGYNGVLISLHRNYTEYIEFVNELSRYSFLITSETASFIISLKDRIRYRPLTFSTLAEHIIKSINLQER